MLVQTEEFGRVGDEVLGTKPQEVQETPVGRNSIHLGTDIVEQKTLWLDVITKNDHELVRKEPSRTL